jgi:hypothetical protein
MSAKVLRGGACGERETFEWVRDEVGDAVGSFETTSYLERGRLPGHLAEPGKDG